MGLKFYFIIKILDSNVSQIFIFKDFENLIEIMQMKYRIV